MHYIQKDICYIEPITHPEYMCHIVYLNGRTILSTKTSDVLINRVLLKYYGATIQSRKLYLKEIQNITRMGPIIIDADVQFVLFPVTTCKRKNPFYINVTNLVQTSKLNIHTELMFTDGNKKIIHVEHKFVQSQYAKSLLVLDSFLKQKAFHIKYNYEFT